MSSQDSRTQLLAMGFEASEVEEALRECSGNFDEAVSFIRSKKKSSAPSDSNSSTDANKTSSDKSLTIEQLAEFLYMLTVSYVAASKPSVPASAPSQPSRKSTSLKPNDSTVGLCTRKDEFAAKLSILDPLIQQLTGARSDSDRDLIAARIIAEWNVIECLIRYREPSVACVFLKLLDHDNWSIRGRALYGLKMIGGRNHVVAISRILEQDPEPQVREHAASALGQIGGTEAHAALQSRFAWEYHPYVRSTIVASLQLAVLDPKPFIPWSETLIGPPGARRVEWRWQVKGKHSFNNFDGKSSVLPKAESFCYPVSWYKQDLFTSYPRKSFGAGGNHAGEDCAWFREGCSLYAIADGLVRMVQGAGGDWGFLIVIEHLLANGEYITSVYGHAASDVLVKPGDFVKKGQKIGSQGLSTSVENGGYGSHLHFGLGFGPFRRSGKIFSGGPINLKMNGVDIPCKVARFGYSNDQRTRLGWPRITAVVALPDGTGRQIVMPEEQIGAEVSWLKAYVPNCRGWIDPQRWLPDHVNGEWDTC